MYIEKYKGKDCRAFEFTVVWQGTIHILRQKKDWVGGQKMAALLTSVLYDDIVGGYLDQKGSKIY